ncbi:MAG: serine/threonine protein kinase [Sandaracinus sp.]|nr:serine/threonine protein kinase [Sandaracinus sp.]
MSQAELQVVEGGEPNGQDKLVGQTIDGRYLVEKVLGEGGMGLVYKAKHVVLQKPLALKVLRPDVSKDEEIITRFRQEAQSASAIGNQHIIDISDFGTLGDGSTYFVMEFLEGVDLPGAIEAGPFIQPARAVYIVKQLCQALGAAHDAGIVHRDLKPDNIYLIRRGGDENFVKVLDFGIAKVGGSSSKLTRAGQVFGTPHYMSPEQCAGSGVDHRTDVYALGIILYEMCTGVVPFDADNLMGILTKHLYEEPIPPRQRNPKLPEELELVILKAITKQADQRYQSMQEFFEDLERLEAGVGTVARETTRSVLLEPEEEPASTGGGKGPLVAIAVVLLLGLAGGGAWFAMQGGEPEVEAQPTPPPIAATPEQETPEPEVEEPEVEPAETAMDEAAAMAEPVMVTIQSEPEAEVWRGDEYVGRTPVELERPEERLELELRAEGYETRGFAISSLTSQEVSFRLERERRRRRGTSSRRTRSMESAQAEMASPPPMMETPMMSTRVRPTTEVLDPWANE